MSTTCVLLHVLWRYESRLVAFRVVNYSHDNSKVHIQVEVNESCDCALNVQLTCQTLLWNTDPDLRVVLCYIHVLC